MIAFLILLIALLVIYFVKVRPNEKRQRKEDKDLEEQLARFETILREKEHQNEINEALRRQEEEKRNAKVDYYNFMNSSNVVEIDKGWWPLVEPVYYRIHELNSEGAGIRISQVKEKYGELRIYIDRHCEELDKMIQDASEKSTSICEHCGSPAEPVFGYNWWIYTLCPDCLNSRGIAVMYTAKEYRDRIMRMRQSTNTNEG